jgi:PTS system cellobiose-specific IIB component
MEKQFKEKLTPLGIPVAVIKMSDYGMMNGANVLTDAEKLMN